MPARSKIDRLPPAVRRWIERALIDKTHDGYKALEEALRAKGFHISDTSIWRHDQRLQRVMDRIRASTEAARMIAAGVPDAADEHSAAVLRMVQSALFEAMTRLSEAAETEDAEQKLRVLSLAARAIAETSRASIGQKKWAEEVREKLDRAEAEAERRGRRLDPETLKAVREALYGG